MTSQLPHAVRRLHSLQASVPALSSLRGCERSGEEKSHSSHPWYLGLCPCHLVTSAPRDPVVSTPRSSLQSWVNTAFIMCMRPEAYPPLTSPCPPPLTSPCPALVICSHAALQPLVPGGLCPGLQALRLVMDTRVNRVRIATRTQQVLNKYL